MKFNLAKPCANCPFLKVGGIRLSRGRINEIAGGMLSTAGRSFVCHQTVREDEDGEPSYYGSDDEQHCAGALIFAEKHGNATQIMRIMERIGLYDAKALMSNRRAVSSVFDTISQMRRTALR